LEVPRRASWSTRVDAAVVYNIERAGPDVAEVSAAVEGAEVGCEEEQPRPKATRRPIVTGRARRRGRESRGVMRTAHA
jgi:hypothetical protein